MATESVILRVTNSRPRSGDSWLNRMPEVPRIERGLLDLGNGLDLAEHFRGRRLVEADLRIDQADRLEQVDRAQAGDRGGGQRLVEGNADEALRRQVVNLIRFRALDQAQARGQVGQVVFDQRQVRVRGDAQFLDTPEVGRAGAAEGARHVVALLDQQLRQVGAVLAGDAGNDGPFGCSLHGMEFRMSAR